MVKLDSEKIILELLEGGNVANKLPSYEPRQAQLDLLELIIKSFNEDAFCMAEAGTGVGKSFAYLLPVMHFAQAAKQLSGNKHPSGSKTPKPVVISTATITLQQQLYEKDIPLVSSSMDGEIKTVLMKGRGNYICIRRLEDVLLEPPLDKQEYDELKKIDSWAKTAVKAGFINGGKSELPFMPSDSVWAYVCCESDLCLGNHCSFKENCFIIKLRKEASNANIIVVNHHLLFADLSVRSQGAGYENAVILPAFDRLVIDEAHTIEHAATSFFSAEFSRIGIFHHLGKLLNKRRANYRGLLVKLFAILPPDNDILNEIAEIIDNVRKRAEELDEYALEICANEGLYRLSPLIDESFLKRGLFPHLKALRKQILKLTDTIRGVTESLDEEQVYHSAAWETRTIIRRFESITETIDAFCKYKKFENDVLWIERKRSSKDTSFSRNWAVFTRTPLDLAPKLKESVFSPNKTVVCVSATLALNEDFSFWAKSCGITDLPKRCVLSGCFPSPFPYSSAVLLAVPVDAPLPDETGYQEFINKAAGSLVSTAEGSTLVLFTSYQSLTAAYLETRDELNSFGIRCLKQGDDDRTRLLNNFVTDIKSCLFATNSFWEGVDAPGDTLKMVIICRLPFRTPDDPVLEARCEAIQKKGGNPFMELSLPLSVMKFKQGFGRLMRRSGDKGVVIVLDGRILKKSYGKLFLQSLPETKTSFDCFNNIIVDIENFLYS
ncbi:MAG: ATP-dependent DNA helicase DinG [Treponema sp.]|jgi:ATP-dependent DNA helicase DinG|nr:ATP-dependent DNA helicase DinG [Treponema sp.]